METNKLIMGAIIINVIFGIVQGVQIGDTSHTLKFINTFSTEGNGWINEMKESDNLIVKGVGDFVEKALNIVLIGFKIIGMFLAILIPAVALYGGSNTMETYILSIVSLFITFVNIVVIMELWKIWRNKKT